MEWHTVSRLSPHMHETSEGYLVVRDVPIARTGNQIYYEHEVPPLQGDSGGRVHVSRDASEVFKPQSIQSFIGKPICDDHPTEPVGPDNWNALSIGYVSNPRRGEAPDDDLLLADMIFTSRAGIKAVKDGKRAISVGYNAYYDQTAPGLGRQRDIHCNHVALVDEGRCGSRCTIMDGFTIYNHDAYELSVRTSAGKFNIDPYGAVTREREGLIPGQSEVELLKEFSRPEWLTDVDYAEDEDIDYADAFEEAAHPRVAKGTSAGGQFGKAGAGGSEASNEAQGAKSEKAASLRERAHKMVKGFTEHDYRIMRNQLHKAGSEPRKHWANHIKAVAKSLPHILKQHGKEEIQKAKHAAGALRAIATGQKPSAEQISGLKSFATRILMSAGSMALSGDPTGTVGHIAAALAHEVVQHVVGEHALQLVGSGARAAYAHATAGGDAAPDEPNDDELSDDDLRLLKEFLEKLAEAAEQMDVPDDDAEDLLKKKGAEADTDDDWHDDIDYPTGDAEFEEAKHKRAGKGTAKGGQFTKGGAGGNQASNEKAAERGERGAKQRERGARGEEAAAASREASAETATSSAPKAAASQVKTLSKTSTRAFTGQQIMTKTKLTKQETGAIGEAVITQYLKQFGGMKDARPLNTRTTNFPVDLIGDHQLIEAKTGLVSNSKSAQKWRATIGQPGKEETKWLKTLPAAKKAAWNAKKYQAIIDRKQAVLDEYRKKYGNKVKGKTMTTILNPDTRTADVFEIEGFHLHLRWGGDEVKDGYRGTFKY